MSYDVGECDMLKVEEVKKREGGGMRIIHIEDA